MHARLIEHAGPCVAMIGSWDPLLPGHLELFGQMVRHARQHAVSSAIVMLDPSPTLLLHGRARWPEYDDADVRIGLVRSTGIDAVLHVRMTEGDVLATAAGFFELITSHLTIGELWMGATQTLGRGPGGSAREIARIGAANRFELVRLQDSAVPGVAGTVRSRLLDGRLAEAVALVGRAPVWRRPAEGHLRLAWRPGVYQARKRDEIDAGDAQPPVAVELIAEEEGGSTLVWPGRGRYLQFLSGPFDAQV